MCDTLAALPPVTAEGETLFAKSADCEVNEANALVRVPRARHLPGEAVRVTHLVIPQAPETCEVLLTKAFWTWGCEIGVNEHGLCMGEEAVFTTEMSEAQDGLIGPDLMRLGLERARTCREAISVMTTLLERYGQGGSAELKGNSHFDSSFLMADPHEAYVLETAGRKWAVRRIRDFGSISNGLSIGTDWERCPPAGAGTLDWAGTYGLPEVPPRLGALQRQQSSFNGLAAAAGSISATTIFHLMRRHGDGYDPATAPVHSGLCMHAGPQKDRWWQADGVMVADLRGEDVLVWATGTSANCLSIFKPVFPGVPLPDIGPLPAEHFDPACLWWRHELLHRRVMADFFGLMPEIRASFDEVERDFLAAAPGARRGTPREKSQFMDHCFRQAMLETEAWITRLELREDLTFSDPAYRDMWKKLNAEAGLSGMPA
ncbi:MAG TPA: C69 family dipeptidase [Spirochaetia bacterium]|nr:C69 family dipeptidase [Spirochaetia bacterium]